MKQVIYKYPLELTDLQAINLTEGYFGRILDVQDQNGQLQCWVLQWEIEGQKPKTRFEIAIVGTGNTPPEDIVTEYGYLKTLQIADGRLIWHIFTKQKTDWPKHERPQPDLSIKEAH